MNNKNHKKEKLSTQSNAVRIGISHGDINGISYEIMLKAFSDSRVLDKKIPIVFGNSKVASYHKKALNIKDFNFNLIKKTIDAVPNRANIINIVDNEIKIDIGKKTSLAGELAFKSLDMAVAALKSNHIDVLVTCPINKHNIQSEKFDFPGHTEYLIKHFGEQADGLMLMIHQDLRIGVLTGHIPLKKVSESLSVDLILKKLRVMNASLRKDFAVLKPKIALLSLNPHAGDDGLIGKEEKEIIIPAINKANEEKILAFGPFPADGFFSSATYKKFDAVLAMYHDQGMIPFKTLAGDGGVNYTAGLSVIRTSPAHGTAFDIAGKGKALPDSFREAFFMASDIYNNRKAYEALNRNSIK